MKNIIGIFFFTTLSLVFSDAFSQTLTSNQRRIVNENMLQLVGDYEKYSRFTANNNSIDENYVSGFMQLFNENAEIYNDIFPANRVSDPISVSEYIREVKKYYSKGIGVRLHDILFDAPVKITRNIYHIDIDFSKEIYGYTNSNVNYRNTIQLVIQVEFSMNGDYISDIKISGITGESKGRFLNIRTVKSLTHKPLEGIEIKLDNEIKKSDESGKVYFENIDPNDGHTLKVQHEYYKPINYQNINIDRYIAKNTDKIHRKLRYDYYDQNEVIYMLRPFRYSVWPLASVYLPGLRTVNSEGLLSDLDIANLAIKGRLSGRIGIRFGVSVLHTKKLDISVLTGIEKSYLRAGYLFDKYHKEYPEMDKDNDAYTRLIDLSEFEQKIKLNFTDFPILVSFTLKNTEKFQLTGVFGIRYSLLNSSIYSLKSKLSVSGLYEQYDNLIMYNYTDIENFRSNSISMTEQDFITNKKYLSYQLSLLLSKRISRSIELYAGPSFFIYSKLLNVNDEPVDFFNSDEETDNILVSYQETKLRGATIEFGMIYHFSCFNFNKIP